MSLKLNGLLCLAIAFIIHSDLFRKVKTLETKTLKVLTLRRAFGWGMLWESIPFGWSVWHKLPLKLTKQNPSKSMKKRKLFHGASLKMSFSLERAFGSLPSHKRWKSVQLFDKVLIQRTIITTLWIAIRQQEKYRVRVNFDSRSLTPSNSFLFPAPFKAMENVSAVQIPDTHWTLKRFSEEKTARKKNVRFFSRIAWQSLMQVTNKKNKQTEKKTSNWNDLDSIRTIKMCEIIKRLISASVQSTGSLKLYRWWERWRSHTKPGTKPIFNMCNKYKLSLCLSIWRVSLNSNHSNHLTETLLQQQHRSHCISEIYCLMFIYFDIQIRTQKMKESFAWWFYVRLTQCFGFPGAIPVAVAGWATHRKKW